MPNRIIKESAFTSDKIAALSDFEFRLWVGLITYVDDAGRGDARPAIIKGRLFPLRERITVKDVENALHSLAAKGCVSLYEVGGKPYFWFPTWCNHQRIRDVKPKYPGPDDAGVSPQVAADCGGLPQVAADCGLNPIQSESGSESESESESERVPRAPTREDVHAYAKKRNSDVDPDRFFDYFEAGGWIDSRGNPVKAWKQKFITWERMGSNGQRNGNTANHTQQSAERDFCVKYD